MRAHSYQFNPTQTNIDTIAKILVKALMQLPANDFTLYLSLLNDQVVRAPCSVSRASWIRAHRSSDWTGRSLSPFLPSVRVCQLEFEPLPQIVVLQELLETARFGKFWASVADIESVTSGIAGFSDAVRRGATLGLALAPCARPRPDPRRPTGLFPPCLSHRRDRLHHLPHRADRRPRRVA